MASKTTPSIINQHDYIRINFGNGRGLTVSYSGERSNGAVPEHVFKLWSQAHQFEAEALKRIGREKAGANHLNVTEAFVAKINEIWPDWKTLPKVPKVGDRVTLSFGKRKGLDTGTVEKVRGTSVTARFDHQGLVSFAADMLQNN